MNSEQPVSLQVPGLAQALFLHVHPEGDQVISPRLRAEGIWEPYETQLLLALLQPGDVLVDVGANIGYFSLIAAAAVGEQGRVIAFEPHATNFDLLQRNVALNDFASRIECVCAGLSDRAGAGALYVSAENSGDHQIYAGVEQRRSAAIKLLRGADFLRDRLPRIDVVKIDTQGSEARVVTGLLPLLQQAGDNLRMLVELTPFSLRQAGSSGRQLIEQLASLKLPFWIVDHVQHRLWSSSAEDLARWCDNWDAVPNADGFMNILVGKAP